MAAVEQTIAIRSSDGGSFGAGGCFACQLLRRLSHRALDRGFVPEVFARNPHANVSMLPGCHTNSEILHKICCFRSSKWSRFQRGETKTAPSKIH